MDLAAVDARESFLEEITSGREGEVTMHPCVLSNEVKVETLPPTTKHIVTLESVA